LARTVPLRFILTAAALTGVLALEGCGRKGLPDAPSSAAAEKAAAAPAGQGTADPTVNTQGKLPHGVSDPALKAGARKESTPFDFLL
jgi:predicted small lipoprotein YifL